MIFLRSVLAVMPLLLSACATPPNTAVLEFKSVPSAAAILGPGGRLLGVTPFSMERPLTKEEIAAGNVQLGTGTVMWNSGAKIDLNFHFTLNGLSSGTVKWEIQRPNNIPGLLADIKFSEDRERQATSDTNEGWAVLGNLIRDRNRQRAAVSSITEPLALPEIRRPSVECTSQVVWPKQVQTICK